jgi:hypothetical protein
MGHKREARSVFVMRQENETNTIQDYLRAIKTILDCEIGWAFAGTMRLPEASQLPP